MRPEMTPKTVSVIMKTHNENDHSFKLFDLKLEEVLWCYIYH